MDLKDITRSGGKILQNKMVVKSFKMFKPLFFFFVFFGGVGEVILLFFDLTYWFLN